MQERIMTGIIGITASSYSSLPGIEVVLIALILLFMSLSAGLLIMHISRIKMQRVLRSSDERFRTTFEQAAVGILHTTLDGRFIRVNKRFCELVGYSNDELLNMSFSDITHPDDIVLSNKNVILFLIKERKSISFDKRYIRKDGSTVWANLTASISEDLSAESRYLIAIVQDITDRKNTETAVLERESRLKRAQSIAHVGFWELDLGTGKLWASEESFSIYGYIYSPDQPYLSLSHVQTSVCRADRPVLDRALTQLVAKKEKYDLEYKIVREEEGETRYLHSVAELVCDDRDKPTKVLGVLQDITDKKLAKMALEKSEAAHKAMIANIADVIAVIGVDGTMKYVSPNVEKWFGRAPEELAGANVWDIVHPDDAPWLRQRFAALLERDGNSDSAECRYKRKDGVYKTMELTAVNMINDPHIGGILMNYHDITERKRAQIEYKAVLQTAMDGLTLIDAGGRILDVNDAYCRMLGYGREELLSMTLADLEADRGGNKIQAEIFEILANGSRRFETSQRCKDGRVANIEISSNAIPNVDSGSACICSFIRDITERKRYEENIVYLGYHDNLTGLYNRTFFDEKIRRLEADGPLPVSVIMGDINGLKLTNDVFGHAQGDRMLAEIAKVMQAQCREEDSIARIGGDEFCILLPGMDAAMAQAVCGSIYSAFDDCGVKLGDSTLRPSISLGYSTRASDSQNMEGVLKEAEDCMYKKKLLERKSMHSSLVSAIRTTLSEKSYETKEHADRLITYSKAIGQRLKIGSSQMYELELLAVLHDIGKIGVDDRILNSPNKLADDEWAEMKKHPEIGYRIALASPELVSIADCILSHHERWDGTGYPQGLKGGEIPLLSRILAVVDAFDAMINDRPYRKAMPVEDAVREIADHSGRQFDPDIAALFIQTVTRMALSRLPA